jgi:hypothetical protein
MNASPVALPGATIIVPLLTDNDNYYRAANNNPLLSERKGGKTSCRNLLTNFPQQRENRIIPSHPETISSI